MSKQESTFRKRRRLRRPIKLPQYPNRVPNQDRQIGEIVDVIPLLKVIDAIASQVPVPKEWQAGFLKSDEVPIKSYTNHSGRVIVSKQMHTLRVGLLNGFFLSAYRYSQAAGALDCYLDRIDEKVPSWLDSSQTGWHKVSEAARSEGLAILVHMSRYFDRYRDAYQAGRLDDWPQMESMKSCEGKFKKISDEQRLGELSFYRLDLIEFLDAVGIPHSLEKWTSLPERDRTTNSKNVPMTAMNETITITHSDPILSSAVLSSEGKKMRELPVSLVRLTTGRDALTSIIELAISRSDKPETADVWVQLRDIAVKEKTSPFTGVVKGLALQFKDDYNFDSYFTREALRGRLKRRNQGR